MKFVRYVFVVSSLLIFLSFVGEETARTSEGLQLGNVAPKFELSDRFNLNDHKGQYVLVNFWAAYDANSRAANVSLWNEVKKIDRGDVVMVSVSFDDYESVFKETIKMDGLDSSLQFRETDDSDLYEKYKLQAGFTNYLLDESGKIVAKGISSEKLNAFLKN